MSAFAPVAVVAGSGIDLTGILDTVFEEKPFTAFPHVGACTAQGHVGAFTRGLLGSYPVIVQCGRRHFYEGLTFEEVTATVDVLHAWGVTNLILTNAVGGLVKSMRPGDLAAIESIQTWPYAGWPDRPDRIALDFQIDGCAHRGSYCWMHGPSYETRAEIRLLQAMGGHVVGMSAAPETVRAQELGMRVAVVSCITNNCCETIPLTHDHVVATAQVASARLTCLLRDAIPRIAIGLLG